MRAFRARPVLVLLALVRVFPARPECPVRPVLMFLARPVLVLLAPVLVFLARPVPACRVLPVHRRRPVFRARLAQRMSRVERLV